MPAQTRKRTRTVPVEDSDFFAMLGRLIRAGGKRASKADPVALKELLDLVPVLNDAIDQAARELNETGGFSWLEIAREVGITKQSAHGRWAAPLIKPAKSDHKLPNVVEPALPMRSRRV
mgnify:CR=1 FL=1